MILSISLAAYIVDFGNKMQEICSILQYILVAGSNTTLNHLATLLSQWAERPEGIQRGV